MHVTSSQTHPLMGSMVPNFWGLKNSEGVCAIEFDIHGDRQCQYSRGGTECLAREFPEGFGMKLSDQMSTTFDVNDVRNVGSAPLRFFVQYSFKWTRSRQRPLGRLSAGAGSTMRHDAFLLRYNRDAPKTQYMLWDELLFPATVEIVHPFWHSHHKFSSQMWWFSATKEQVGLGVFPFADHNPQEKWEDPFGDGPFARPFNLTSVGWSIEQAAVHIFNTVEAAQRGCVFGEYCLSPPTLRCTMNLDRWDRLDNGELQERFHAPHCLSWTIRAGALNTIISFHQPPEREPLPNDLIFWMHDVAYALYIGVDEQPIPHAMVPLPASFPPHSLNHFIPTVTE